MYEIVVHESADEELTTAAVFYESRETDLGQEFLQDFPKAFIALESTLFSTVSISMNTAVT
jgi:hypothetical protein